ncbi:hypothetical protein CYY_009056 [Polysphondylium violaceum]|uniref:Ras-GAP domain-containing protein n=1 Tax=Polysphondylium violaceum TaxID=133409 RepID=A0A8J4V3D0_9MYCE|nr:hypothetical protein CYY_009056 [Polysphondylium violaceum]
MTENTTTTTTTINNPVSTTTAAPANHNHHHHHAPVVFGSKYKHNLRSTSSLEKVPTKYNEIIELLLSPDLELVNILCSLTLVKETLPNTINISEALVLFFEIHCNLKSSYLLKWAIDKEVENTANGATLFRGLSTATRLISAFYKRVGDGYLKYLLQPFILDLCSRNFSFEIDPEKAGKGVNVQSNLEKLITITQQLLDKILDSIDQCPQPIRHILNHTQEKVEKKFNSMKTTVVGGFIFLRYICPAIVAPEVFGLISDVPSTDSRRGLVLVSKLLQNLANEMPFGVGIKEEFMLYLNDFISNNSNRIHSFFDQLASEKSINNESSSAGAPINNGKSKPSSSSSSSAGGASHGKNHDGSPPLRPIGSSQRLINNLYNQSYQSNSFNEVFTDDAIMENLNILISQLYEHKERIDQHFLNENNIESLEIQKKLDSALTTIKQKHFFSKVWGKRSKDTSPTNVGNGTNGNSNGNGNNTNPSSINNNNNNKTIKKSISSGGDNGKPPKIILNQSVDQNSLLLSDEEMYIIGNNHHGNSSEIKSYYKSRLESKDLELKVLSDEVIYLKKELEETRTRSNVIKKLREELEEEKRKRKEAEQAFRKAMEKFKSLGHLDVATELSNQTYIPEDSCSDLASLIEDTLEISSSSSQYNSLRKRKSQMSLITPRKSNHLQVDHNSSNDDSTGGPIKKSITNGSIAESTLSQSSVVTAADIDTLDANSFKKVHSRNNSNDVNTEMTSSESCPMFDIETEDRIIQACVDGDVVEEDDEGMDLLEFLKEVGERVKQGSNLSTSNITTIMNGANKNNQPQQQLVEEEKKKRGSILLKHFRFGSSSPSKKDKSSPVSKNKTPSTPKESNGNKDKDNSNSNNNSSNSSSSSLGSNISNSTKDNNTNNNTTVSSKENQHSGNMVEIIQN